MPSFCCAPNCSARGGRDKVSFFRFPKDEDLRKKWIAKIRRDPGPSFTIGPNTLLCSQHFKAEDMERKEGLLQTHTRLKPGSVPSVFNFLPAPKLRRSPRKRLIHSPQTTQACAQSAPILEHTYSARTEEEKVEKLQERLNNAEQEIYNLEQALQKERSRLFRIEKFTCNDAYVRHFTGFKTYQKFNLFYEFIFKFSEKMSYWHGQKTTEHVACESRGRNRALDQKNELFLTMCRLRRGFTETDLAALFDISVTTVSSILVTWINLLYHVLGSIPIWPSKSAVQGNLPQVFKKKYPGTRVILDCTELAIQVPSSLVSQSSMYSHYKGRTTLKGLIGISPDGTVVFVSDLYSGSISDKEITRVSGILDLIEQGDVVMADKGFLIEDLLAARGATSIIPPFKIGDQLLPNEVLETQKIASVRIYVENAIGRIKWFRIFDSPIQLSLMGVVNQMWVVCCLLSNLM